MLGPTIGHYRVLQPLGAGGMGEVYAAQDTRLNRKVALKVLASSIAGDPDRRDRFEREAQAIAALNHPNIVTIYSVEEDAGVQFLTMELIEGKTLDELIPKGGMSIEQIFKLATPLADAISAAHQAGITHRDLKPGNIMVTGEGRVKVLDFGLAKLRELAPAAGVSMLPTQQLTGEGRIVGTVAYMSPEQAEGKPVDGRSDIFSLGILLYEMSTGERPFKGDTSVSIISSIIKDTPVSATAVNRALPSDLARIIRHCLAKDPGRRFQTAADLRNELEELKQGIDSGELTLAPSVSTSESRRSRNRVTVAAVALPVVAAIAAASWLFWRRQPAESHVSATFSRITSQAGAEDFPSLSPDGKWIVYSSETSGRAAIYLQGVGGQAVINLTKDSTSPDLEPVFSPDGDRIAFRSERQGGGLYVMGRMGESPKRVSDSGFNPAWSPSGEEVVFATEDVLTPFGRSSISELWIANVNSGQKRLLFKGDAVQPSWSPHGKRIAYWGLRGDTAQRDIWTLPAAGGEPIYVTNDAAVDWNPFWSPDGKYLYFLSNRAGSMNLWRVHIDEDTGRPLGAPEALTTPASNVAGLTISADGRRIAYASRQTSQNIQRVDLDPERLSVQAAPAAVTSGSNTYGFMSVSPDGQWLAFSSIAGSGVDQENLFISHADGSDVRQLTNEAMKDRDPQFSPDGKRIAFYSNRDSGNYGVWIVNVDGSELHQLTKASELLIYPRWTPDGSRMSASDINRGTVMLFDPRKAWTEQRPETLPRWTGEGTLEALSWSPDGRRIAGDLTTKHSAIVVYSLDTHAYEQLTDFGFGPVWMKDGRRLVFTSEQGVFVVDSRSKAVTEVLRTAPDLVSLGGLSPDERHLYLIRTVRDSDIWMATLK
jgi:Tol biopolymer transport system component/predicted Ser/Thr protein kinase